MSSINLERDLKQVATRFWWWSVWQHLTWVWLTALAIAWLATAWAWMNERPWPASFLFIATIVSASWVLAAAWLREIDMRWVAQQVEAAHPELQTKLLAAWEQEQHTFPGDRGYLQMAVIEQATTHALAHARWKQTVPSEKLWAWSSAHWLSFLLLVTTFVLHMQWSPVVNGAALTPLTGPTPVTFDKLVMTVEPGNVELERGTDLLVLARFAAADKLPREVTLHAKSGRNEVTFPLQQSLSDPLFAVRVPEVKQDMTYRLAFHDATTPEYRVTVFDYPELERADAELTPPSYTNLPTRRVEDIRQFSVIEGTQVQLICRMNKPLATARLIPATGEPITLNPLTSEEPLVLAASQALQESVRWKLELTDDAGRKNRQPVEFVIDVVRNARPELKLVFPKRDLKVSPLQEVSLESEVADDFGVLRWGLEYEMTGRQKETITFGEQLAASEKQQGQRVIALEDLQAKADELLAWHVWAEDLGPDGKVRRTTSDIFFAEVSPFEEIFREQSADSGEGQPQEKQQNPVEETAGKQKEIVTAIWNLRRREEALLSPSSQYAADVQAIAEAQERLLASLPEMKAKLQSPDASVVVTEIEQHMQAALTALTAATASKALPPLNEALPAAQAAYQSLLKLRARENRVMKSKSAKSISSSGSQQSAAGQELDQLEMNQDEQRYETKKSAADAQQTPAQKEREQIMNRLRELAKRQEDTNQKVKELQAALDAAKTAEQQQQLERQLKRLRDEQRDVLRDVDQLKNKVEKPEHNQPLMEASRQLQETRENARQASDALEKGQTQQALAAGTRTENALDKLREDFRKQNASQVANEVRELVEQAQQIDERQQKISQQLTDPAKEQPPRATTGGLRAQKASPTAPELGEQLAEQKKELAEVLEKAKALTERVEGNEPLLSKQLYDTVRQAHQKQTQRAVEIMKQLTDSHLPAEAKKLAPQAEQGVKQLRAGIEKAAEGVLGNDVESLRRAKQEVDRLAQALSAEMAGPQAANENSAAEKPNPAGQPQPAAGKTPNEKQPAEKAESGKAGEASSQPNPPSNQPGNSPGSESKLPESKSGEGKSPADKSGEGKSGEAPQPGSAEESPGKAPSGDQPQQSSQASQQQGTQTSGGVLTGGDWREWSDALRNVEEFVPGTRLRADAARVREQAQAMRAEFKRHSKAPNWDLVRETIYEPLMELQRQLDEELQRRASPDAAVPLDRDPVPDKFGEAVKRYYERLGSGQ